MAVSTIIVIQIYKSREKTMDKLLNLIKRIETLETAVKGVKA